MAKKFIATSKQESENIDEIIKDAQISVKHIIFTFCKKVLQKNDMHQWSFHYFVENIN